MLFAALSLLFAAYYALVQPWFLNWGATATELRKPLPGDEIIPTARRQQTRAITIAANIDSVWPWLAQIGQDRGGFYSFDALENLVGCDMPTEDYLRPGEQCGPSATRCGCIRRTEVAVLASQRCGRTYQDAR
jgi:hypothetical protein